MTLAPSNGMWTRLSMQALLPFALLALPSSPTVTSTVPLDLNRATPAELETLPGIGPTRAQAIVARRDRRPFRRVGELVRIRGIGRKTLRRLRKHLVVRRPEHRKTRSNRSRPSE